MKLVGRDDAPAFEARGKAVDARGELRPGAVHRRTPSRRGTATRRPSRALPGRTTPASSSGRPRRRRTRRFNVPTGPRSNPRDSSRFARAAAESTLERGRKHTCSSRSGSLSQVVDSARSRRDSQCWPGLKTAFPACSGSGLSVHDSSTPKLKSFVTGREGGASQPDARPRSTSSSSQLSTCAFRRNTSACAPSSRSARNARGLPDRRARRRRRPRTQVSEPAYGASRSVRARCVARAPHVQMVELAGEPAGPPRCGRSSVVDRVDAVAERGDVPDRALDENVLVADEDAADDLRHCRSSPRSRRSIPSSWRCARTAYASVSAAASTA